MAFKDENGVAKIVLTNFIGARVIDFEDECGMNEKGVFIPLDMNGLRLTSHGHVSCYAFVMKTKNPEQYGWSHYLRLKGRPDFCQKMKDLGYQLPYLGNFKHQNFVTFMDGYKKSFVKKEK